MLQHEVAPRQIGVEQGQRADLLDECVERRQVVHSQHGAELQGEPAVLAVRCTGGPHAREVPRMLDPDAHDVVVE